MTEPGNATHDDVRRYNLGRILRHVHTHGSTSRSELVALMRLNRSTVADLVATLGALGLVVEETGSRGSVGRPSLVVSPVPEAAAVLAFRVDVHEIAGAVIGLGGRVLARRSVAGDGWTPDGAVAAMGELAAGLLDDEGGAAIIVGVGVSIAGTVDAHGSLIRRAPNLGWLDVSLAEPLAAVLEPLLGSRPEIRVGNDANLGAVAERLRGAAVGAQYVIYVQGGVGIGAGIVADGRLLSGAGGFAGEAGHMIVDPGGRLCSCGAHGCWETVAGRDAILEAAGRDLTLGAFAALVADAEAGDPRAKAAMADAVRWTMLGLRALVTVVNPEVVILGGHLGALLPCISVDEITRDPDLRIVAPQLGADSPLVGAAELAFGELLGDPTGAGRSSTGRT